MTCFAQKITATSQVEYEQVITQEWHIALCKNRIIPLFDALSISQLHRAEILTIISELGYNLFFHAHLGGRIIISRYCKFNCQGIIIESIDSGPGIQSMELCLQDGYSTNGGLGGGLPGIKRLSDEFEISQLQQGTWVRCLKWFN